MDNIPEGFFFAAAAAEIKYSKRDDIALIYCPEGADVSAVFTKNSVKAAPVIYSSEILKKNEKVKAIFINSGNANACTGNEGIKHCYLLSEELKKLLASNGNILITSTGVIGVKLPVDKIISKLPELIENLSRESISKVAKAIMTTDTFPKIYSFYSSSGDFSICGIAKGAGMINPNMATMLAFILTDAFVDKAEMDAILSEINEKTFNSICVDGDTSTNDSVLLMSSSIKKDIDMLEFKAGLEKVMKNLAKMIVKDGEGATKFIKFHIKGGRDRFQCKKIGEALSKSLLVKTAFFGGDPNWGRIICTIGYADGEISPENIDIYFGDYIVVKDGMEAKEFKEQEIAEYLTNNDELSVTINLNLGNSSWVYYTCDLSYEYVKINAEYRT